MVALLVGLSVAPQELPGDTLRLTPRAAAGAMAAGSATDGSRLDPAHTVQVVAATVFGIPSPVVEVPAYAVLLVLFRARRRRFHLIGRTPPAFVGRGPPAFG
jgi:hypothetical protein